MTREYSLDRYRNFGIMAHIDAGKDYRDRNGSFIIQVVHISSVKSMTVTQPWTGWSKSKSVALRLLLQQPRVFWFSHRRW